MNGDAPAIPDPGERHSAEDPIEPEIELLLKRLSLRSPSAALDANVLRAIEGYAGVGHSPLPGTAGDRWEEENGKAPRRSALPLAGSGRRPSRFVLIAAAAAIAVALGTVPLLHRQPRAPDRQISRMPAPDPVPVRPAAGPLRIERQFARVADDGIIGTAHGVPWQLLHYSAVRQIWYFDPKTGRKLQVTVPRDQTFLVPVRTF